MNTAETKELSTAADKVRDLCLRFKIALLYVFGSQAQIGLRILQGREPGIADPEADIDFAVLFEKLPEDALKTYALLSVELQELVSPFRADLLFLHEVDHLIQLEAIREILIYAVNDALQDTYEERVRMFAADELQIFRRNEKDMFEAMDDGYFEFEYQAPGR